MVIIAPEISFEPLSVFAGESNLIIAAESTINSQIAVSAKGSGPIFIANASKHFILFPHGYIHSLQTMRDTYSGPSL